MMYKTNTPWTAMSDAAIVEMLGTFIRHHRLEQNKSQSRLAEEAGIHRSTLVEFEKGKRSNTITFIQLLRALNLLHAMEQFKVVQQMSPIQLAEMEQAKRKRASKAKVSGKRNQSDW